MKYYIIAGEASGDLHGGNLIHEIKKLDEQASFRFWGGDQMGKEAGVPVKHIKELAFMGFFEVIMNLRTILKNIDFCKKDITQYQPDALILIDYPGFNLRIAEFAKSINIKVFYYISPQIWAWKQSRVHKIKKIVHKMMVILPFETAFYEKFDYPVYYVGHPLLDEIKKRSTLALKDDFKLKNKLSSKPIIALLPGSRKQEINKMLPIMLSVVKDFPEYEFIIAGAASQELSFYEPFLKQFQVKLIHNQTYELLQNTHAALVTSGTATLEAALFQVPQVVCYKANSFSYIIAKNLIKVKYISLVNLILDFPAVKELIQDELNYEQLKNELALIIKEGQKREEIKLNYQKLSVILQGVGASQKTAQIIFEDLSK